MKQWIDEQAMIKFEKYNRDTKYWDNYYKENKASTDASLFALNIFEKYLAGKKGRILELGCGNGRDSRFFISRGYDVTAADASQNAIKRLQEEFADVKNAMFLCGDFVNDTNIYKRQYDYCYSRFSIHAINEEQEKLLLSNVFETLKKGGYFFIETRGVHDELYGLGEKAGEDAFFYDGHYRRFIRKEKLQKKLEEAGFAIASMEESRGFAPYGEENPMIIRCIASKAE